MATSTLIQRLEPEANGSTALTSDRSQTEDFIAGGTIAAGDWVAFDTSQTGTDRVLYVVEAAGVAITGNPNVVGVALNAATSGVAVKVVVGGYVGAANVAAATVAGSPLVGPIGTAGEAAIEAPGTTTGTLCGVALEADTANVAAVWVIKRF